MQTRLTALLGLLAGLLLALAVACGSSSDSPMPTPVEPLPVTPAAEAAAAGATAEASAAPTAFPDAPADTPVEAAPDAAEDTPVEAAARKLLAEDLGVAEDALALVSSEPMQWSDASLGCPMPGYGYAQVITPGHKVIFEHSGAQHAVHTNDDGSHGVVCDTG